MSIDYTGFIPLIIESIKELEQTISEQKEQIEYLQNALTPETKSQLRSAAASPKNELIIDGAKLFQKSGAAVSYSLPAIFSKANLQIFDISGKLIKEIDLDGTNKFVEIERSDIGYGTFVYVLLVDGKKADVIKKYVN